MCLPCISALHLPSPHLHRKNGVQKESHSFGLNLSNSPFSVHHRSGIADQLTTFQPHSLLFKQHWGAAVKSFRGTQASVSLNSFSTSTDFTIYWAFFMITWAGESFRQHGVGGCPFVSMHSICVGCLLASALLWMGHWKPQAAVWQMQTGGRLIANSPQTDAQTVAAVNQLLVWNHGHSGKGIPHMRAQVLFDLWPGITLYNESYVMNEKTILCRMRNVSSVLMHM